MEVAAFGHKSAGTIHKSNLYKKNEHLDENFPRYSLDPQIKDR